MLYHILYILIPITTTYHLSIYILLPPYTITFLNIIYQRYTYRLSPYIPYYHYLYIIVLRYNHTDAKHIIMTYHTIYHQSIHHNTIHYISPIYYTIIIHISRTIYDNTPTIFIIISPHTHTDTKYTFIYPILYMIITSLSLYSQHHILHIYSICLHIYILLYFFTFYQMYILLIIIYEKYYITTPKP